MKNQTSYFGRLENFTPVIIEKVINSDVGKIINWAEIIKKGGFVECGMDGRRETVEIIKKETKATIRCIPFNVEINKLNCIYTNNPAKHSVVFAKAY